MERDEPEFDLDTFYAISTHTLTWSVTQSIDFNGGNYNFNSHAHVERDISASMLSASTLDFNSHAHVERDAHVFSYHFI